MAKDVNNIKAEVRSEFGKGAARRARREFKVPAVLYGHGTDPRHLLLPTLEFAAVLRHHGANSVLTMDIDGEEQLALTKQVDVNPLTRVIEHADLLVVKRGEKVTVEITITVSGEPAPGTLVTQDASVVEVEADALSIPEGFEVSVEGAESGTQITAADITLPSGVTLVSDPETLLVNVMDAPTEDDLAAEEDDEVAASIEESQQEDKAESESEAEVESEGGSDSEGDSEE